MLEEASVTDENFGPRRDRMYQIIHELKRSEIIAELTKWNNQREPDLMEGMLILEKIENARVNQQSIENQIDKIRLDAWLELNYDVTSFEQIKILNYIFYEVHGFKGNIKDYHSSNNSFLSTVLANKTGNPVSLAIVYSLIAQRLNIPVYGVNLPQHFVLGYQSVEGVEIIKVFNDPSTLNPDNADNIMFYINPFSDGLILNFESLKAFLTQLNIEHKPMFFRVCTNPEILQRVLRNLQFSYEKQEEPAKVELVKQMLGVFE